MARNALMIALLSVVATAAAEDRSSSPSQQITSDAHAPYYFAITDRNTGELIDYDALSDERRAHYDAAMAHTRLPREARGRRHGRGGNPRLRRGHRHGVDLVVVLDW